MTDLRDSGDRIEQLLDLLRDRADPRTYDQVEELLASVCDLYGGGLARIVELVGERAPTLFDALVADELIASLLLVHGLHPVSMAQRVEAALDRVRPLLATHGGDVELLGIDAASGRVRLRLLGSCDGCPSSAVTLQSAVERAVLDAAPEVTGIDVDQPAPVVPAVPVVIGSKPVEAPRPVYEHCPSEGAAVSV